MFISALMCNLPGGKDSLVTLDLALEGGASVSLMYVADGLDEFEASWRLRRMAEMNPDVPIRIGTYLFVAISVELDLL
jgi:tRNA(Ile)-lysidine synthase TilS/MesJ